MFVKRPQCKVSVSVKDPASMVADMLVITQNDFTVTDRCTVDSSSLNRARCFYGEVMHLFRMSLLESLHIDHVQVDPFANG